MHLLKLHPVTEYQSLPTWNQNFSEEGGDIKAFFGKQGKGYSRFQRVIPELIEFC